MGEGSSSLEAGGGMKSKQEAVPEYSFEEGVPICVKKIQELMQNLKRDVIVVVNASRENVGTSTLVTRLQIELKHLGIDSEHTPSTNIKYKNTKVVFSLAGGLICKVSPDFKKDLHGLKSDTSRHNGDFYIGICRPDKRFKVSKGYQLAADIIICNEYAKDKS